MPLIIPFVMPIVYHVFSRLWNYRGRFPQSWKEYLLAAHAYTDIEATPEGVQSDLDIMNDMI